MSIKKTLLLLLITLTCISCKEEVRREQPLIEYLPNNPSVVISANSIENLSSTLQKNALLSTFKNTATYNKLSTQFSFCTQIESNNELLLSFSTVGKEQEFLFSIKQKDSKISFDLDPTKNVYENINYQKLKNQNTYTTIIDSTIFVCSSEILLENLIRNQQSNINYHNDHLNKLYQTQTTDGITLFINNDKQHKIISSLFPKQFIGKKEWMSLELHPGNGIRINGTGIDKTLANEFATALSQSERGKNKAQNIIPSNFISAETYSFDQLSNYTSNFENFEELVDNSVEIIKFSIANHYGCAFQLINTELEENFSQHSSYRDVTIYKNEYFKIPAVLHKSQPEFACILDDFLILSNDLIFIENCISHFQNKTTLANQHFYKDSASDFLNKVHYTKHLKTANLQQKIATILNDPSITEVNIEQFPLLTHQISYEDNYIHINSIAKKISAATAEPHVEQLLNIHLDHNLIYGPQVIFNHKTKQPEIVVQDNQHQLYVITNEGKIKWKKQLDSKVQGNIVQVDIYKNRKLQMAFTTEKSFIVLDRNGNTVAPFHKTYTGDALQPLGVFDYDNNRNYRFAIAQGKKLTLLDNKGAIVKGFNFSNAKSTIIGPAQHMRLGTKDYIVFAEQQGKVHILDRRGNIRTKVKNTFDFNAATQIQRNKNTLVFLDTNNAINSVNIATGAVEKLAILEGSTTALTKANKTLVTLSDNNLTIGDHTVEIDYGTYTTPQVFNINGKTFISLTDKDTQKVYLFNEKGTILPKFPVYGSSVIALKNLDEDDALEFAVQGEANAVLVYKIHE